uniref:WRKY domain-containing protein n=1 Tax=Solanum lycopersicum TaxID=4081 RepID=A0A3Q7IF70_SOLLC
MHQDETLVYYREKLPQMHISYMQNCWAAASAKSPTVFEITYRGFHNCHQATYSAINPTSPEKQELKKQADYQAGQYSYQVLMNLRSNLRGNTNDLDKNETACSFSLPSTFSGSSYSPSFVSPTTPEWQNRTTSQSHAAARCMVLECSSFAPFRIRPRPYILSQHFHNKFSDTWLRFP